MVTGHFARAVEPFYGGFGELVVVEASGHAVVSHCHPTVVHARAVGGAAGFIVAGFIAAGFIAAGFIAAVRNASPARHLAVHDGF